jgi:DNA polymerase-3 subunit chi
VNLHPESPPSFSRFERLIEIVGTDDDDRQQARGRFRFYRDRGYEIHHHDLAKSEP